MCGGLVGKWGGGGWLWVLSLHMVFHDPVPVLEIRKFTFLHLEVLLCLITHQVVMHVYTTKMTCSRPLSFKHDHNNAELHNLTLKHIYTQYASTLIQQLCVIHNIITPLGARECNFLISF